MKAYRAPLLYFGTIDAAAVKARFEQDGLLVVGPNAQSTQVVLASGSYQSLHHSYPDIPVEHFPGRPGLPASACQGTRRSEPPSGPSKVIVAVVCAGGVALGLSVPVRRTAIPARTVSSSM